MPHNRGNKSTAGRVHRVQRSCDRRSARCATSATGRSTIATTPLRRGNLEASRRSSTRRALVDELGSTGRAGRRSQVLAGSLVRPAGKRAAGSGKIARPQRAHLIAVDGGGRDPLGLQRDGPVQQVPHHPPVAERLVPRHRPQCAPNRIAHAVVQFVARGTSHALEDRYQLVVGVVRELDRGGEPGCQARGWRRGSSSSGPGNRRRSRRGRRGVPPSAAGVRRSLPGRRSCASRRGSARRPRR